MSEYPIVHVDIPAQDPQAAGRFYSELFGWQVQPLPGMQYVRFQSPHHATGGFVGLGGPVQHQAGELLVYVGSDDIDGDLRKAEQLGGKTLIPKTVIPNTGWLGVFQDPAGNRVGLFHRTGFISA